MNLDVYKRQDRVCGGYTFSLIKEGEGSYLLVPFVGCGRKKDLKRCNKWKGSEKSCVEKFSDCPEPVSYTHLFESFYNKCKSKQINA